MLAAYYNKYEPTLKMIWITIDDGLKAQLSSKVDAIKGLILKVIEHHEFSDVASQTDLILFDEYY